jgi:hypothetical protein
VKSKTPRLSEYFSFSAALPCVFLLQQIVAFLNFEQKSFQKKLSHHSATPHKAISASTLHKG